jgi:hypothetical protein
VRWTPPRRTHNVNIFSENQTSFFLFKQCGHIKKVKVVIVMELPQIGRQCTEPSCGQLGGHSINSLTDTQSLKTSRT